MRTILIAGALSAAFAATAATAGAQASGQGSVRINLDQAVNTFVPDRVLGAGVDGLEYGDIGRTWTRRNIAAMRSAGFGPLSYRLRTELGAAAWHWNPRGTWSDAARRQGYWTSNAQPGPYYGVSYGYRLPRRGNTIDQANNSGFSRLDDGNIETFWKSSPYLDSHFTGESDDLHPQWIMVDFERRVPLNALRIVWGNPYARRFKVQWWTGNDAIYPAENRPARWQDFTPRWVAGRRPRQTVRFAAAARSVQFVRILLSQDSNTAPPGSRDIRDRLGFAVREIQLGRQVGARFQDAVRHAPSQRQTTVFTSSTDPWHRARDLDRNYEHASFERTFASGLTNGQPLMVPVAVLYGTPEDAVAELRYLRARGYPITQVEVGEEPDGQVAVPEDYASLYVQFTRALKAVDPTLAFGGPGFQTSIPDWVSWPDARGRRSWTGRFVSYLRDHGAMEDFDFFSFEWYPFDDVCANPGRQLAQHPNLMASVLRRQEAAGLPREIPKIITEYGFSAFAGEAEVDRPGAMLNAEIVGKFLTLGGSTAFYYGYEPNYLIQEEEGAKCNTWGNLTLFQVYGDDKLRPLATQRAAQMVTQQWAQPGNGSHAVRLASSDLRNASGQALVSAYAVTRPDGRLAVMLLNKDPRRTFTVRLLGTAAGAPRAIAGPLDLYQLSAAQYVWHARGENGYASPNRPPGHSVVDPAAVRLPPYSLSVARTQGAP